jgi:hypothetical protein
LILSPLIEFCSARWVLRLSLIVRNSRIHRIDQFVYMSSALQRNAKLFLVQNSVTAYKRPCSPKALSDPDFETSRVTEPTGVSHPTHQTANDIPVQSIRDWSIAVLLLHSPARRLCKVRFQNAAPRRLMGSIFQQ